MQSKYRTPTTIGVEAAAEQGRVKCQRPHMVVFHLQRAAGNNLIKLNLVLHIPARPANKNGCGPKLPNEWALLQKYQLVHILQSAVTKATIYSTVYF